MMAKLPYHRHRREQHRATPGHVDWTHHRSVSTNRQPTHTDTKNIESHGVGVANTGLELSDALEIKIWSKTMSIVPEPGCQHQLVCEEGNMGNTKSMARGVCGVGWSVSQAVGDLFMK